MWQAETRGKQGGTTHATAPRQHRVNSISSHTAHSHAVQRPQTGPQAWLPNPERRAPRCLAQVAPVYTRPPQSSALHC